MCSVSFFVSLHKAKHNLIKTINRFHKIKKKREMTEISVIPLLMNLIRIY